MLSTLVTKYTVNFNVFHDEIPGNKIFCYQSLSATKSINKNIKTLKLMMRLMMIKSIHFFMTISTKNKKF